MSAPEPVTCEWRVPSAPPTRAFFPCGAPAYVAALVGGALAASFYRVPWVPLCREHAEQIDDQRRIVRAVRL